MKRYFRFFKEFIREKPFLAMFLIGVLYFIGVASIIYPMLSNVLSLRTSENVINDYQQNVEHMSSSEIADKTEKAALYNRELSEKGEVREEYAHVLDGKDGIICYVDIPKVDIYLPVYYGTSDEVLAKGCGYLENTSLPVGGKSTHSVISGHTGLPSADMFTRLDELKKGDTFFIHILDKVLTYKVNRINTVTPNAVEELYITDGKDYVTLLTCTPYGINDKRLLIRGERVVSADNGTVHDGTADEDKHQQKAVQELAERIHHDTMIVIVFLSAAVVLFVIACLLLFFRMRKIKKP